MEKNFFVTHNGLYRYNCMPFGLNGVPVTFQRAMDVLIVKVKWQKAMIYIDEIISFWSTPRDHIKHVESVLRLIDEADMTLKWKKCYFFSDVIDYPGHVITPGRLHVAEKTKETIRTLTYTTSTTELQSVLGFCDVFRNFVSNFAKKVEPLNKLLKKRQPMKIDLDEDGKIAVDELKNNLINPPILALSREDATFKIEIDVCHKQTGFVLLQPQQDDQEDLRPIGNWSWTLNDPEI